MPNEKLPEINEHDAEELIHYPQDEEQKERRSCLLPGRWTRRVQKSSARAQARRRVAEKQCGWSFFSCCFVLMIYGVSLLMLR